MAASPTRAKATVKPSGAKAVREVPTALAGEVNVTSTEAQTEFGRILDQATHDEVVVISRHAVPRAVLLSIGRYRELAGAQATMLDTLTAEFDAQFARMQDPDVWAATERGFRATPNTMGQAAKAAARRSARRGARRRRA